MIWSQAYAERQGQYDTCDTLDTCKAPSRQVSHVSQVSSPPGRVEEDDTFPPVTGVTGVTGPKGVDSPRGLDLSPCSSDPLAGKRPASWSDHAQHPQPGWWCGCCYGHGWWTERDAPQGWRCATCHPPDHLPAAAVRSVVTSTTEEGQAA